jgi:phage shock protein A
LSGVNAGGALAEFERMEEKVEEQEAQAKAYADLDQDTLDTRFRELEQEDEVAKELAEIKARKAAGSSGGSGL